MPVQESSLEIQQGGGGGEFWAVLMNTWLDILQDSFCCRDCLNRKIKFMHVAWNEVHFLSSKQGNLTAFWKLNWAVFQSWQCFWSTETHDQQSSNNWRTCRSSRKPHHSHLETVGSDMTKAAKGTVTSGKNPECLSNPRCFNPKQIPTVHTCAVCCHQRQSCEFTHSGMQAIHTLVFDCLVQSSFKKSLLTNQFL